VILPDGKKAKFPTTPLQEGVSEWNEASLGFSCFPSPLAFCKNTLLFCRMVTRVIMPTKQQPSSKIGIEAP
jgi:hypothetical protein